MNRRIADLRCCIRSMAAFFVSKLSPSLNLRREPTPLVECPFSSVWNWGQAIESYFARTWWWVNNGHCPIVSLPFTTRTKKNLPSVESNSVLLWCYLRPKTKTDPTIKLALSILVMKGHIPYTALGNGNISITKTVLPIGSYFPRLGIGNRLCDSRTAIFFSVSEVEGYFWTVTRIALWLRCQGQKSIYFLCPHM